MDWVSSSVIHSELCLLKVASSSESEDAGGDKRMLRLMMTPIKIQLGLDHTCHKSCNLIGHC